MPLDAWLAFCATHLVVCLTPGPAVLFVSSAALSRGHRAGLFAALGILAGNTLYFALSGTGVAAVIVASSGLFTALRWAGGLYLAWMGLRMLRSRGPRPAAPEPVDARFLARGFLVQGANPKALVFFVALLPQFIDPGLPVAPQLVACGASGLVIELAVLWMYILLAGRARGLAGDRWRVALERGGGGLLVAAGARLAMAPSR